MGTRFPRYTQVQVYLQIPLTYLSHASKRNINTGSVPAAARPRGAGRLRRHQALHRFVTQPYLFTSFHPSVLLSAPLFTVNSCLDPDDDDYRCEIIDGGGM